MSTPQDRLINLISMQRKDVPDIGLYGKMTFDDIKRLDRCIFDDIFNSTKCCLYNGTKKGNYCMFSFRGKKTSVLRLIYHNYIEDVNTSSRIKHFCKNEGICCNINHFTINTSEIEEKEETETELPEKDVHNDQNIFDLDI